jgi:DNA-binding beta-propeller fold protein YncE
MSGATTTSYQVYVSFSGETGSKIQNVGALAADGTYLGLVLNGVPDAQELRGLAVDAAGRLYVANAYKKASAVLAFSATINADGYSRDSLGTVVDSASSKALLHPYGLAFDGETLFVSNQDTNVVSAYAIAGKKTPKAKTMPVAPYLEKLYPKGDFYGGTFVASAMPVPVKKKTPPAVNPKDGGLWMTGFDPATAATDDKPAEAPDEAAPAAQQARHSVRGIAILGKRLYVADQAKDRVGIYGHRNGTFHGWIERTADSSDNPDRFDMPVGVQGGPDGRIYIGSPKNEAIFAYDPGTEKLALAISSAANPGVGHALKDLSGLAFTPDGTLLFGSRHSQQLYACDTATGKVTPFGPALDDAPECLLVVRT